MQMFLSTHSYLLPLVFPFASHYH